MTTLDFENLSVVLQVGRQNANGGTTSSVQLLDPAGVIVGTSEALIETDGSLNGMNLQLTQGPGAPYSGIVTDYVAATRTATVSPAISTAPTSATIWELYPAVSPNDRGAKFRLEVAQGTAHGPLGGTGGEARLVVDASGDFSQRRVLLAIGPNGLLGQNGDDGYLDVFANMLSIISYNNLTVNGSDALDVGPQIPLTRMVRAPAGSMLGFLMFQALNEAGNLARYVDVFARVADWTPGAEKGGLVIKPAGATHEWNIGGLNGGGLWLGSATDGRAPYSDPVGTCDNKGDGSINFLRVYERGHRVGDHASILASWSGTTLDVITSHNISSVSRLAPSIYQFDFIEPFPDANYNPCGSSQAFSGLSEWCIRDVSPLTPACAILQFYQNGVAADPRGMHIGFRYAG